MKIALIPPSTKTGEYRYSNYLTKGLQDKEINIEIIENPVFRISNLKITLGSLFIDKLVRKGSIIHNLDNLSPFLFKNDKYNKKIMTIMDIAPVIFPDIHSKIMNFDFKKLLPKMIDNTNLIIVPSISTKNDLINYFKTPENKIRVIPLGIDNSIFYQKSLNQKLIHKYGIFNDYLLYVGTDNPRKNLKNLILGFGNIIDQIDYDLVLVGPINRKKLNDFIIKNNKLPKKNELLKRIVIPGYIESEDLPSIYSEASALVFPSLYEGFGFPPLEAMACKTPVITSDNSSLREVVGDSGFYIKNPLDYLEIGDKIKNLSLDPKLQKKLGKKGFERSKKFNWNETTKKTIKVYEEAYYGN